MLTIDYKIKRFRTQNLLSQFNYGDINITHFRLIIMEHYYQLEKHHCRKQFCKEIESCISIFFL